MYLVKIWTFYPYKIEFEYRERGSNFSVATSKAIKQFRKEPRLKGRRYTEVFTKAIKM